MKAADLKGVLRALRARHAHQRAIVMDGIAYSYKELEQRINICNQAMSCIPTPVIVNTQHKLKAIILMLSAIDCGVTFIPVDGDRPRSFVAKIATKFPHVRVFTDVCFDTGHCVWHTLTHPEKTLERTSDADQEVMSIMYTSGSTGEPKGVQVRASSVLNLLYHPSFIALTHEDVVASYSSLSFDASTFEIFAPLLCGGTLVLLDKMVVLDETRLHHAIKQDAITCMWMTAGLFRRHMLPGNCRALARLRHLIVGGDKVDLRAAVSFLECAASTQLYNGYGPTENTVFTTVAALDLHQLTGEQRVPIGRKVEGVDHLIEDEHTGEYRKVGIGRLHVTGEGLCAGYHANPVETAEAFTMINGRRYYNTGDIVECTVGGDFYFLGRQDRQVKLNGHRVELDDVEKTLESDPSIVKAVCFVWKTHLVSLVETQGPPEALETIIARWRLQLSSFSVPDFVIENTRWPLTKNNKIDTRTLINETIQQLERRHSSSGEWSVKRVAEQVLNKPVEQLEIGLFDLGFDSLSMLTFNHQLNEQFEIHLNLLDLYTAGTLLGVEQLVTAKMSA